MVQRVSSSSYRSAGEREDWAPPFICRAQGTMGLKQLLL